jgi:hypothetical protein
LIVAAATAVVGCGVSAADADRIREAIRQCGAALANGRGKQACAALTPSAAADVVKVNAASGFATCRTSAHVSRAEGRPAR